MTSKKKHKEKQVEKILKTKARNIHKYMSSDDIEPFHLESWMGYGHNNYDRPDYIKLSDVIDKLDIGHHTINNVSLPGRAIGCPSEINIHTFNAQNVYYTIVGNTKEYIGKSSDYLVRKI